MSISTATSESLESTKKASSALGVSSLNEQARRSAISRVAGRAVAALVNELAAIKVNLQGG